jgi:hypothetical protein|tara:strand:- start:167 stop:382 length:216 start_codon:yes stop_codon:yes gene_type:complete
MAFIINAQQRKLKSFIMSYTYKGTIYSIKSPINFISVNKHNVVVNDQNGTKLIKFGNNTDSKCFLEWIYQA